MKYVIDEIVNASYGYKENTECTTCEKPLSSLIYRMTPIFFTDEEFEAWGLGCHYTCSEQCTNIQIMREL